VNYRTGRTLDDEASSVAGRPCHAGGRALEPGVVVRPGGGDVKRRPAAVRLDTVPIVPGRRQHPAVLLPADHRHRDPDSLGGEQDRLSLAYRLVLKSLGEAWC